MKFKIDGIQLLVGALLLAIGTGIASNATPKEGTKQNPHKNCKETGYVTCRGKVIETSPAHWGKVNITIQLVNGDTIYIPNSKQRIGRSDSLIKFQVSREGNLGKDLKITKIRE